MDALEQTRVEARAIITWRENRLKDLTPDQKELADEFFLKGLELGGCWEDKRTIARQRRRLEEQRRETRENISGKKR